MEHGTVLRTETTVGFEFLIPGDQLDPPQSEGVWKEFTGVAPYTTDTLKDACRVAQLFEITNRWETRIIEKTTVTRLIDNDHKV